MHSQNNTYFNNDTITNENCSPTCGKLNQIKSKGDFSNIRSNYILKEFFNYITKIKTLRLVKVNKNIQKRLDLSINDYKEYSQKYSTIEIELKFDEDKFGKFINLAEEDKKYFHIYFTYFNDSKEETKRTFLNRNENVKMVNIIIDNEIISFISLFDNCKYISSICFKKFIRNDIINMDSMFSGCESLKELDLSNFNTSNVTSMSFMFYRCSSLKELELSNFNTSNVITMNNMFLGCSSLNKLNISSFNTINVTKMRCIFYGCESLNELNLSSFILIM